MPCSAVDGVGESYFMKSIYIYGAGKYGVLTALDCELKGIKVVGFIDRDAEKIKTRLGLQVLSLESIPENSYIIIAVQNEKAIKEIIENLKSLRFDFSVSECILYNNRSVLIDKKSIFEGANKVYYGGRFSGEIGYGSYIGMNTVLTAAKIGRFCSIAPNVSNLYGTHPTGKPFATTSPMFYSLMKQNGETFAKKQYFEEFLYVDSEKKHSLIIGNDVWVGEGALFVGAITVGDGCIISSRAVVTKDVPPYAIVGGVPAKVIRYRYDEDTIKFLLTIKWWEKDVEWLRENAELMCDIEKLKEAFKFNEKVMR